MQRWWPVDVVVLVLTASIALSLLTVTVLDQFQIREVTGDKERLVSGIVGGILAIISLYVGARIKTHNGGD